MDKKGAVSWKEEREEDIWGTPEEEEKWMSNPLPIEKGDDTYKLSKVNG